MDAFDDFCRHLLVRQSKFDNIYELAESDRTPVVGTCRLLSQHIAAQGVGFYSESEFDLAPLLKRNGEANFLEIGRSCVLKDFRVKPVLELLWQGIWNYARLEGVDVMFGCASFLGTDIRSLQIPLSYLAQNFSAPAQWQVRAKAERYVPMNSLQSSSVDPKKAISAMPPLIKGYLRLGCFVGDGAVLDYELATTDIMIILPVSRINPRYIARFSS